MTPANPATQRRRKSSARAPLPDADSAPGSGGVMERFDAGDLLRDLTRAGFEPVVFEGAGGR